MTELKTLKDIEKHYNCGCCDIKKYVENMPEECEIRIKDLKAEAIKWIKELPKLTDDRWIAHYWIVDFFNLTEDDLKSCKEVKEQ